MVGVPSSCVLLGGFAIRARVSLHCQHTRTPDASAVVAGLLEWNFAATVGQYMHISFPVAELAGGNLS